MNVSSGTCTGTVNMLGKLDVQPRMHVVVADVSACRVALASSSIAATSWSFMMLQVAALAQDRACSNSCLTPKQFTAP